MSDSISAAVSKRRTLNLWRRPDPWAWGLGLLSACLALPVIVVFSSLAFPDISLWQHLADTVLSDYIINSLLLAFGVGLGSMSIGTGLAWCIVRYQFFGRAVLQWLVLLPLAMPAYIIAYTYTGMLDFAGPVQSALREQFDMGYGDYWFPEIRSLGGAIIMMTLVLYPYVYMLARTAFAEQAKSLEEASKTMGLSAHQHFLRVSLPLARPAIFTGTLLAMMEAFADYGTVQYFGISTFTTGIFRTWFGLGSREVAAQLASVLCVFVLILLVLERHSRKEIRYYQARQTNRLIQPAAVTKGRSALLFFVCMSAPVFGFIIPVMQLVDWAAVDFFARIDAVFMELIFNSFGLALGAALLTVFMALMFAYGRRLNDRKLIRTQVQVVSLGYAIPGTVIAVGVMIPLSWLDQAINAVFESWFAFLPGLIFSGTLFALLLAYSVRFLAVALQNIDAGLSRITPSMDNAARSLGLSPAKVLRRVHLPMLTASVMSAALLVFVDVLKELPATLILRPFNFNTLAVRSYELASDERLNDAALPALAIVVVGLLPVILLTRALDKACRK